jgi:phospholipid/cholesterol/gamma-HCH transport system substrate-binding protein
VETDTVECRVVDGRDPRPGDGYDENGSNIRGEQNIGGDGGRGTTTPEEQVEGSNPLPTTVVSELMGRLLHANPIATLPG